MPLLWRKPIGKGQTVNEKECRCAERGTGMIKFRLYFDKDKETKWLNEMAAHGYAMKGFFLGVYTFEECVPGEWLYQIDIKDGLFPLSENYREFMEEAGVEIVCCWGFWVILRRKAAEGPFELYTDVESTIGHYTKIRKMFKVGMIIELICMMVELIGGIYGSAAAWAGACLIAVFVLVFARQVIHINDILAELKSRIGEQEHCGFRGRKPSGLLVAGLLLNSCALMLEPATPFFKAAKGFVTGAAVVLMLAGLYLTVRYRE